MAATLSTNQNQQSTTAASPGWQRWALRVLATLALAVFLWRWYRTYCAPEGDFTLHWIFGRRFLAGGFLYAAGMHTPYPPFWAMASSLLNVGPMATVRVILYPFGLVPLGLILLLLSRRLQPHLPLGNQRTTWALTLALLLCSRFLIRELPECGANLMMVALSWCGVYAWTRRRDRLAGALIGLATALKCTSALFLVYFAWKRQWRLVAAGALATGAFSLAPALWMGPSSFTQHMGFWLQTVRMGLSEPHPVRGVLGDEETGNLALKPALGRLLVALPPTHKGYLDHPWRLQPLDLPPEAASIVIKGLLILILGTVALLMTRKAPQRDGLAILWEAAAISVLLLLLSPITWRQHCVGVLPLLILVSWRRVALGRARAWVRLALGFYILAVLVLDRGVIGRDLTLLLDSYGITAWALLALLAIALEGRAQTIARETHTPCQIDANLYRIDSHSPQPPPPHEAVQYVVNHQNAARLPQHR